MTSFHPARTAQHPESKTMGSHSCLRYGSHSCLRYGSHSCLRYGSHSCLFYGSHSCLRYGSHRGPQLFPLWFPLWFTGASAMAHSCLRYGLQLFPPWPKVVFAMAHSYVRYGRYGSQLSHSDVRSVQRCGADSLTHRSGAQFMLFDFFATCVLLQCKGMILLRV